jgi:hypothetical protein
MANDVQTAPQAGLTELMRGIVNDIGDLIQQQFRFARTEVKSDLRKAKAAIALLASGAAVAAVGGILLSLMIVHLIHWLSVPPDVVADPARIPLWGCYGLTALLFLVVGGGLVWGGLKRFEANNPLPDQTLRSVEENVSWIAANTGTNASSK